MAGGEVTTTELVGAFRAVEAYDPATNSWITLPSMPMPRHGVAGAVIGNRFHLVSGMIQSAGSADVPRPDALHAHRDARHPRTAVRYASTGDGDESGPLAS